MYVSALKTRLIFRGEQTKHTVRGWKETLLSMMAERGNAWKDTRRIQTRTSFVLFSDPVGKTP